MAARVQGWTANRAFVVALGLSAAGHVAALRADQDAPPPPVAEPPATWGSDGNVVQVFDEPPSPAAPEEPASASTAAAEAGVVPPPLSPTPRALPVATALVKSRAMKPQARRSVVPARLAVPSPPPPTDAQPALAPTDETSFRGATDPTPSEIEDGVITPRETWRAAPGKAHAPSISGMPPGPSPDTQAQEEPRLAPGVARLETAFTRSVPYYNYADPAWDQLPLGQVGSMTLTFVVDANGQIIEATAREKPAPVLERLRRRTLFGLRRGRFAIAPTAVHAGRRTLRVDVSLEERPVGSQALPAVGFKPPHGGHPGVATMHLESGRFVTVRVLPLED